MSTGRDSGVVAKQNGPRLGAHWPQAADSRKPPPGKRKLVQQVSVPVRSSPATPAPQGHTASSWQLRQCQELAWRCVQYTASSKLAGRGGRPLMDSTPSKRKKRSRQPPPPCWRSGTVAVHPCLTMHRAETGLHPLASIRAGLCCQILSSGLCISALSWQSSCPGVPSSQHSSA
jgi:hypothetical protein